MAVIAAMEEITAVMEAIRVACSCVITKNLALAIFSKVKPANLFVRWLTAAYRS